MADERRRTRRGAPAVLPWLPALLLLAGPGTATERTIQVPDEYRSIQQAVDAAEPGDTILIGPGLYPEEVAIPRRLHSLTLQGAGAEHVVLDPAFLAGQGAGILVRGHRVALRDLTIRHVNGHGISAVTGESDAPEPVRGITLERVTVEDVMGSGVGLMASQARLSECTVRGVAGTGVWITDVLGGDELTPRGGEDAVVEHSTVRNVGNGGVYVRGVGARVANNEVECVQGGTFGLSVDRGAPAISVEGDEADVTSNTVRNVGADDGIVVTGDRGTVRRNGVSGLGYGRGLVLTGSHLHVGSNKVSKTGGDGILVTGNDNFIRNNKSSSCGVTGVVGIAVVGDRNQVEENASSANFDTGMSVEGAENVVARNTLVRNSDDGLVVRGEDNAVRRTTCRGNGGEGLENHGRNTELRANVLGGNRLDLANAVSTGATLVVDDETSFQTGGADVEPKLSEPRR